MSVLSDAFSLSDPEAEAFRLMPSLSLKRLLKLKLPLYDLPWLSLVLCAEVP